MQSTKWYPLQEVNSDSRDESTWWKYSSQNTSGSYTQSMTVDIAPQDGCAPSLNQSIQPADLTITSYWTISPPRHTPPTSQLDSSQGNQSRAIQPESQAPISQPSKAINSPHRNHSHTSSIHSPLNTLSSHDSNSQHSVLSSHSSPAILTPFNANTAHEPSLSSASCLSSKCSVRSHTRVVPVTVLNELTTKPHSSYSDLSPSSVPAAAYKSSGSTLLKQQVSLLELDKLWHKFLATTLGTDEQNDSSSSRQACTCTCGVFSINACTTKPSSSPKVRSMSSVPTYWTPGSDSCGQFCSPLLKTPKLVNKSVQTSQNDLHTVSKPPVVPVTTPKQLRRQPVRFSVPNTTHSTTHRNINPIPTPHTPKSLSFTPNTNNHHKTTPSNPTGPMTLSEAFLLHRPDFILRSQRRERRVREMCEERLETDRVRSTHYSWQRSTKHLNPHTPTETPYSSYELLTGRRTRPKMGHHRMSRNTRRAWERLPEVKRKAEEKKRRAQAETNRLRVQLYQKEVLARMRKRIASQK